MSRRNFLLLIAIVWAIQLCLAATIAPMDDELYYWCWSKDLQPSYFDHPPLTAYLIRASTTIFGDTLFGVRFAACACSLGTLLLIGELSNRRGLGWLLATPMIALGSIIMTPDAPLLFFWTAYAVWLVKIQQLGKDRRWWHWLVGGVLLGLGGMSKYTMALAVPGALLSFLLNRESRSLSWCVGFCCHLLVCLAVMSPVFLYNFAHDFAPLRFQLAHAANGGGEFKTKRIFEFVGTQLVLVGALPFLLLPWCLNHFRELGGDSRLRVSMWLFLFPSIFFLLKGATGRVEGNWPFISYMTLLPLALRQWDEFREGSWNKRWALPAAFAVPALLTAIILVHYFFYLPLPSKQDRLSAIQSRLEVTQKAAEWAKAEHIGPLFAPNYQLVSQLRFQQIEAAQFPGIGRRSHFTMQDPPVLKDSFYLYLYLDPNQSHPMQITEQFQCTRLLARYPEMIGGRQHGEYVIVRYDRVQ